MANTKSAKKRAEKSAAQRIKNRTMRSRMRTAVKKLRAAVAAGDEKQAQALLPATIKMVDSTAQKGIIHRNTAARTKSRLVAALRKVQ
ncbi:MAG: 30S ribosomal protein S20 [Thermoanaerobaculia bacterium]